MRFILRTFFVVGLLSFFIAGISVASPIQDMTDRAFDFSLTRSGPDKVVAAWNIEKDVHLYKHSVSIALDGDNGTVLGKINYPEGLAKHNDVLGDYRAYEGKISISIPIERWGAGATKFIVKYQGCRGSDMCYPPVTKVISITPPEKILKEEVTKKVNQYSYSFSAPTLSSTQQLFASGNFLWILLSFFIFGLFLSLTPCVLPMVPILVTIIMGQKNVKTTRAFMLSLSYVVGMAITYAIAGIITASLGNSVQAFLQNIWVILIFSLLFIALAFSLFGFYEIQLPSFLSNKLDKAAGKTKGGSYIGVAVMGAISSLVVSPCVTAPLAGALIYLASTGDIVLGGSALFALGLGMGVLLLIAGTSGGRFLIKAGAWMQGVKIAFGVVMLGMAIWLSARVLPELWVDILWSLLITGVGIYLGALDPTVQSAWGRFRKIIAFFILLAGVGLFLKGVLNAGPVNVSSVGSATAVSMSPNVNKAGNHDFAVIKSLAGLDKYKELALKSNKPILLDYYADWCVACKELELNTFGDASVEKVMKSFILVKADITENNKNTEALKKEFNVFAPPFIMFLDPEGKEIQNASIAGNIGPEKFIKHLGKVLNKKDADI